MTTMEYLATGFILLCAIAGNCWFWTSFVNRLYSLRLHHDTLDRLRFPHDLGMIIIPVLLMMSFRPAAQSSNMLAVLSVTGWNSSAWGIPWLISALGFVAMVWTISSRQLRKPPAGFELRQSEVLRLQNDQPDHYLGEGSYLQMLSVPGNQSLEPELNQKRFCFANLPHEFDGLRILHISDVHFLGAINKPFYQEVFQALQKWPADLVVFTGDLLDRMDKLDWIDETFGILSASEGCHYILGNHDWHLDCDLIHERMARFDWQNIAGSVNVITRGGASLAIGGDERPWMGAAPDFARTPEKAFRILLSHTPDNLPWARQQAMDLMLSGHNHGGQIKLPLIGPVYAPSRYGVHYADGEFYESPTTLHVSRGLAGKHPLRIRCRPEVTLLTLNRQTNSHC